MKNGIKYIWTDGTDADFNALCARLDDMLDKQDGIKETRERHLKYNTTANIRDVVMAYDVNGEGELPVGCGSFRRYADGVIEIKRMFVHESRRGKGIARELLRLLEQRAAEQGYTRAILETSSVLTPAVNLYHGMNYEIIEKYDPYKEMDEALCMGKELN